MDRHASLDIRQSRRLEQSSFSTRKYRGVNCTLNCTANPESSGLVWTSHPSAALGKSIQSKQSDAGQVVITNQAVLHYLSGPGSRLLCYEAQEDISGLPYFQLYVKY